MGCTDLGLSNQTVPILARLSRLTLFLTILAGHQICLIDLGYQYYQEVQYNQNQRLFGLPVFLFYRDNSLQYALVHHNKDIVDLFGVTAFLLPIMVHDDVQCQFPSELEYSLEMHCMIPLEKVLLPLCHRWALILLLASGTDIPNVVRKDSCRISLRD